MLIDFRREVTRLEEMKWEILMREGQEAANSKWPAIDKRLEKLYNWWVWEMQRPIVMGRSSLSQEPFRGLKLV